MNRRHILLFDPNLGQRRNLAFLLHLAGYRVTEVGDDNEALNRLAVCPEPAAVDLLIICLGEQVHNLTGLLSRMRQSRLPGLIVSEELGLIRPASTWATAPRTCRRHEIIETLAGLWPSESEALAPLPLRSNRPAGELT